MKRLILLALFLSTVSAFADGVTNTLTGDQIAQTIKDAKSVPVCRWPEGGFQITISPDQAQVILNWANNRDYMHNAWTTIAPTVNPQFEILHEKYCK